jgi:hypothetical protein
LGRCLGLGAPGCRRRVRSDQHCPAYRGCMRVEWATRCRHQQRRYYARRCRLEDD